MSQRDEDRFQNLKTSLAELGCFRRGSIQRRFMPCGKSGCRCQAEPPKLHGPYFQWTRKVQGKTVTVRLSSAQAALLRGWISNGKRLEKLIAEMERVSLRLTEPLLATAARKTRR